MNLTDAMPLDEAQIHLLFEEAGLIQAEDIAHVPTGRTVLMSPLMVAAAAVKGELADAREVFSIN
tara:strand:- start:196 stop:390 length:195 start_codon:yes stop_codon:yes gene_type:complete